MVTPSRLAESWATAPPAAIGADARIALSIM